MIKALAHVCVLSADLGKTLEFYHGLLGLEVKFEFLRKGQRIGFYLAVNEHQFIEFFEASVQPPSTVRLAHFCLEVEDMDALRDRLIQAGVPVRDKKLGADQSWQFWCKDPDGVDLEFHQYTPRSAQLTGAACEVPW